MNFTVHKQFQINSNLYVFFMFFGIQLRNIRNFMNSIRTQNKNEPAGNQQIKNKKLNNKYGIKL